MKLLIQFKLLSISEPSEVQKGKSVKAVFSFLEEKEKFGVKFQNLITATVKCDVPNPQKLINNEILAEVEQTVIANTGSRPSIYYAIKSIQVIEPKK